MTDKEKELVNLIKKYAEAYKNLEDFQRDNKSIIPIGDQKTGCIGEFIGKKILEEKFNTKLSFISNPSNKGYDIKYQNKYYQIKTISEFRNKNESESKKKTSQINIQFNQDKCLTGVLIIVLEKTLLDGHYYFINDIIKLINLKKGLKKFTISKFFLEKHFTRFPI